MDSNTKMRKGFMKGKVVMSFYRYSKPSTTMQPYTTNKTVHNIPTHIKSVPATTITATASQKIVPPATALIMNQEKVNPQPKHVSYVIQQTRGTYDVFDNPYGVVVDEGVDAKAATYILCVQERFRLEHVHTDQLVKPAS